MMIAKLYGQGVPVRVHLEMGARMLPDADSGDVIGEIPGQDTSRAGGGDRRPPRFLGCGTGRAG